MVGERDAEHRPRLREMTDPAVRAESERDVVTGRGVDDRPQNRVHQGHEAHRIGRSVGAREEQPVRTAQGHRRRAVTLERCGHGTGQRR